ncbi:MAG: ATPase [Candidatus Zambryskibacteria bacterium CG10_big_fil_rev_8_21_14_0_10_42_12]|uniref:ATPase n=1 Tax=Candidatus Zambryskibacteria bacterium CG10_big_fil_rev_8_21_14_0_10_42_12 TaxID=1975115 RepID=A0A2H0QXK1_9BACT|nr:MAG: ATPase [Candidatus Zambryskibacteria bacterium CG10_big_fil_rev_8_21_14_0_10_42_12]
MQHIEVIKNDGTVEVFDPMKLEKSLRRSGADKQISEEIVDRIQNSLKPHTKTKEIYQNAFQMLREKSHTAAMRYSLKKAIMDLGPTGFPFENLLAALFERQGYKTKVGEIVQGKCAAHEVDVIAWNDTELIMVEAKFHNMLGTKSDLKDALYVKARFDDIRGQEYSFGGKKQTLTEGWLLTNTKFSYTAIEYAQCGGHMRLVGWSYPEKGNLQDMIEGASLHPITCLTTLNRSEEKLLMDKGHILCQAVTEQALINVGIRNKQKVGRILNEVKRLC